MYEARIWFRHQPRDLQESSGDEGELQIAAVSIAGGVAEVETTTVNLFAQNLLDERGYRGPGSVASPISLGQVSEESPYVAYVIRAIERDKSTSRARDLNSFAIRIEEAAQEVLESNQIPGVDTIWVAGNSARLTDRRWRDDDDKIGVSARVFPDFGTQLAAIDRRLAAGWPKTPGSLIPRSTSSTGLLFTGDGAQYYVETHLEAAWT